LGRRLITGLIIRSSNRRPGNDPPHEMFTKFADDKLTTFLET
jgi:hypothetical protein